MTDEFWDDFFDRSTLDEVEHVPCWNCMDCGTDTQGDMYMVHDDVWNSVVDYIVMIEPVPDPDDYNTIYQEWYDSPGMLCIDCLEKRLGRKLTPEDFTDCLLNTEKRKRSPLLSDRMGLKDAFK